MSKRDKTAEREFSQCLTADSDSNLGGVLGNNLGNSSDLGSREEHQKTLFCGEDSNIPSQPPSIQTIFETVVSQP